MSTGRSTPERSTRTRALKSHARTRASAAVKRCATELAIEIVRMPWERDERVVVCNLTTRSGDRGELIAKLKGFTQTLDAKRPVAHASLAVECSPEGRWHAHGVVITSRSAKAVRDVWRKQWPNRSRPNDRGQKVISLREGCSAVCNVRSLGRYVAYALKDIGSVGCAEPGQIISSGLLSGVWLAHLAGAGLAAPVSNAAVLRHPRAGKAVAGSSAPSGDNQAPERSRPLSSAARRITLGKQCRWCGGPISLRRRDAVTCKPGCATSCRRALMKAVVGLPQDERDAFKRLVDVLEADYRLMRRNAIDEAWEWLAMDAPDTEPLMKLMKPAPPACAVCGQNASARAGSTTCGHPGCAAQHRRRTRRRRSRTTQ